MRGKESVIAARENASVTIYFSLIILILLAVMMTTVESARLAGIRVRCQSAAALGIESLFADYASPLFEEYGLLFLEGSYGTGEKEAYLEQYREYVLYNADCNYELSLSGGDFYRSELTEVSTEKAVYATDQEGKALKEQICTAVAEEVPANLLEELLERVKLSNQCKILTKFFDRVNGISDKVSKVDKAVQSIYKKVENLKSLWTDFKDEAEEFRSLLDELEEAWDLYDSAETLEEAEEAWERIKDCKESIANLRGQIINQQEKLENIAYEAVQQEAVYEKQTKKVDEKLTEMHQELLEDKEKEVKAEIKEAIEKQISDMRRFSGGEGDIYQVEASRETLENCQKVLEDSISALGSAGSDESFLSVLEAKSSSLSGLHIPQLEILFDNTNQGDSQKGVLQMIKELIQTGIIGFVMEGKEISSASLTNDELPSKEQTEKTGIWKSFQELLSSDQMPRELLEAGRDGLLIDEYVIQHFADVTKEKEHVLSYETEYILNGKMSDKENLTTAIEQMVLLRTGMNLIYLLSDTESCSQAQTLAMAVVGFTGMMGLVRVTQLLILAAWSYAEALMDVRELVNGGKVVFLKKKGDWKLPLSELGSFGSKKPAFSKNTTGLSYQEYLHILLLKEGQNEKLYRVMDLLQANMEKNGWSGFRIKNCLCGLQLKTEFRAKTLFLNISPMVLWKEQSEGYLVHTKQSFTY